MEPPDTITVQAHLYDAVPEAGGRVVDCFAMTTIDVPTVVILDMRAFVLRGAGTPLVPGAHLYYVEAPCTWVFDEDAYQ